MSVRPNPHTHEHHVPTVLWGLVFSVDVAGFLFIDKVATTTTTGSSAATLSSLVSKKKSAVPVLEYKRGFKDDGNDGNDEEKRSSEEEDTSDDCEDGGDGEILNDSSKKNKTSSKFDEVEYAKLLAEIFPSKYSKKKALTIESSAKKINGVKSLLCLVIG